MRGALDPRLPPPYLAGRVTLSPHRIAAIFLRQIYLLRGSPVRIIPMFAWVAIDVLLWGFITRYLGTISAMGGTLVATLLGAVLLWDFFTRVMHGVATAFLEDVWSRNFLNLFGSPLSISEYLAGLVITGITTSLFGLLIMWVIAACFGLSYAGYGLMLLPFFLVLFLFGIAMGIFGCGTVLRFGPASEWLVWPLPALLSPFAGVFYPISTLPGWMQAISHLVPASYVFEWMRGRIGVGVPSNANLAWGLALAIVYLGLAYWYFARVYRRAVRTGLLARYSAETANV